jgi:Delta3-Delta2-enoyl-CoA isomerase
MVHKSTINSVDILTLDSHKGNLLSLADMESILTCIDSSEKNSNVKGLILTGKGHSFSTGLDTSGLIENYSEEKTNFFFKTFDLLLFRLFVFPKPLIAAINGHSIGGGLLIQCCADKTFIADSDKIKMGFPELKLGLTIDELMKCLLNYFLDNKILSKLLYTSDFWGHRKSMEYGLVDDIMPQEQLMDNCMLQIQKLLNYDSNAFGITKQTVKSDCKEKMQKALSKNCFKVLTILFTEKYCMKPSCVAEHKNE